MDGRDINLAENLTANGFAWIAFGVPAILAWIAAALCWFIEPRLTVEASPLIWAMYAAGGWYALLVLVFGGWLGLLALSSLA
jgi:hypothetical protein